MGVPVSENFRDLEGPLKMRKKDVVLMATITSYEQMAHPSKADMKRFTDLLEPLFRASSEDACRQAAAALSQCAVLPPAVCLFIGSQPISIAAIFLTRSTAIDDETLIAIAKSEGSAHARAIASRENLSPVVVDTLVGLRYGSTLLSTHTVPKYWVTPAPASATATAIAATPNAADRVREELRSLVTRNQAQDAGGFGLPDATNIHEALFVRFGRERDGLSFLRVLTDVLSCSRWMAERIMLDLSGTQLATTLVALGLRYEDISLVLRSFYPHLSQMESGQHLSVALLSDLDIALCREKVSAWVRADRYTNQNQPVHEPLLAANRGPDPRQVKGIRTRPIEALRVAGRKLRAR